ncbi:replication protein A 70 kDa DNA-binding subunit B [Tanacetum coccineum]
MTDCIPFNSFGVDKIRRTLILEDVDGVKLECCFFDAWAKKFDSLHEHLGQKVCYWLKLGHVVMILQLGKVKYFNEKPSVINAIFSTKLFINDDIPKVAAFRQRYTFVEGYDPKQKTISLFSHVKRELTPNEFFQSAIKKMVGSIHEAEKVPPTLAPLNAIKRYTQLNSYLLHKTKKVGIFSIYVHQSKVYQSCNMYAYAWSLPGYLKNAKGRCTAVFNTTDFEVAENKVPPTLAPLDAIKRYTQLSSYLLHKTKKVSILSIYVHQSKILLHKAYVSGVSGLQHVCICDVSLCVASLYKEDGDDEKDERRDGNLNNERDKRKWQSMVLKMNVEEIVCSKREVPAVSKSRVVKDTEKERFSKYCFPSSWRSHIVWRSRID